jgi:hypothetical protein
VSLYSCIEEFVPAIDAGDSKKYFVFGQLTDEQEVQSISIGLASSLEDPKPVRLNDCIVKIVDGDGNIYTGTESGDGEYRVRIPSERLSTGMSYRLEVTTPAGTDLVSGYEELLESPGVDSLYYHREEIPTIDPGIFIKGIQFFLDFDATGNENTYFKFDLVATYEYHSLFPLEWYYDGILHHVWPPDYSRNVCWTTERIADIFILNTAELKNNKYKKYKLHFVDNTSPRLEHGYSLFLRQYSLSGESYFFWDQLKKNNTEREGLYETQPLPVRGNLFNLTHPGQSVLGYFQVFSVKTKRIFVKDVPDLDFQYVSDCGKFAIERGLRFYEPWRYPVYLSPSMEEVTPECIFCDRSVWGETTEKPDFWPETK